MRKEKIGGNNSTVKNTSGRNGRTEVTKYFAVNMVYESHSNTYTDTHTVIRTDRSI